MFGEIQKHFGDIYIYIYSNLVVFFAFSVVLFFCDVADLTRGEALAA